MTSNPPRTTSVTSDLSDRLFLECAELEALIASIKQKMEQLDTAVDAGLVTTEHLMNLAFRVENAERGLITIAHQVNDTATTMIRRRTAVDATDWRQAGDALTPLSDATRN